MLLHTKGILVMTPDSAMVLTGKQSLDFSGGVSAEDNFGIGGYDRVMGPNGQAQYWAPDLSGAALSCAPPGRRRDQDAGRSLHCWLCPSSGVFCWTPAPGSLLDCQMSAARPLLRLVSV